MGVGYGDHIERSGEAGTASLAARMAALNRRLTAPLVACAAAICVALAILTSSWLLRTRPPTVSVGDEALLEIYTLHAAQGSLRVGAYSRFLWNHPGPSLFYLFAPGYALSGYREDSLFATTLIWNLTALGALLLCLRKYGGAGLACAAAAWFAVLAFHPAGPQGWDFGDWLASSWNPHAPMLPLALLMALAAALGADAIGMLPALIAVASFVAQAHLGLAPISVVVAGVSVTMFVLAHMKRWQPRASSAPVPRWARTLDGIAAFYGALLAWVLVVGGFDAHVGGMAITVNSPTRLATNLAILLAVRHVGSREHPVFRKLADRLLRVRWLASGGPLPANTRQCVVGAALLFLVFWSLPLAQEFAGPGPGNLTQLLRFAGGTGGHNFGAGFAAFTYYLPGVVWRGLEVAAAGRTISSTNIAWPAVMMTVVQLVLLGAMLRWAIVRGRRFHIALCTVCLVASATALWSVQRVQGDLYDHLAFWIVIVGTMNLTTITGVVAEWIWERYASVRQWFRPGMALPVLLLCVSAIGVHGADHLLAGHQQARYAAEAADVRTLLRALRDTLNEKGLSEQPLMIDSGQDAWSVTAGFVLELYKSGTPVTVAQRWAAIYGEPLAPSGREAVEVVLADQDLAKTLASDEAYQLVSRTRKIDMYIRPLSRASRVRLRSPAF